ncbi:MAG: hypothetical protein N3E36_02555 [Sulfolobales archaeon]|nr:hypothetical protein [Sulfolobales archaeon]MCX8198896.1 hypothetical protein [Sulfolobales archaeon]MDW8170815.1 hypothetical protein [Desulfurococcaceae archaeon]
MCRVLIAYVEECSKDSIRGIAELLKALVTASKFLRQRDGWGYIALVRDSRGRLSYTHFRSEEPIYRPSSKMLLGELIKLLKRSSEAWIMVHARKSSRKNLIGLLYSHPYVSETKNGSLWLIHNGSLDSDKLARELKVINSTKYTDSELMSKYIASNLSECTKSIDECVLNSYNELFEKYASTALITGIIVLEKGHACKNTVYMYSSTLYKKTPVKYPDYYMTYLVKGDSFNSIVSSTVKELVKRSYCIRDASNRVIRLYPNLSYLY